MLSVLITRPLISSQVLAQEIEASGYETMVSPLLSIQPTMENLSINKGIQSVMITSSNALSVPLAQDISPLFSLPCYCVGTRTSTAAREYGFTNVYDAVGDGKILLQLMKRNMPNNSKSILHIAGRHVSESTHDEFKSAGFNLHYWPVYEAVPVQQLPPEIMKFIAIEKTNVILVFSGRTAQTLCHLLHEAKLETSCKNHIAIGLSETITNNLKTIPWKLCISSSHPTEQSMITRLIETIPAPEVL